MWVLTVIVGILLVPSEAWAWGPYAHLDFGHQVLRNLALLPRDLQQLLGANPFHYLYGTIYADVIIGKNRAQFARHCHNWKVALDIYEEARRVPSRRAFMLGYLSHLAADTIAHNYYVPFKIVESWPTRMLKHLYWELRFDQKLFHKVEDVAKKVVRQDMRDNQQFLAGHLVRTIFSMKINKRIFQGFVFLQNLERWQRTITGIAQRSSWALRHEDYAECCRLTMDAIFSVLIDFPDSPTMLIDARGMQAITQSMAIRRDLKLSCGARKEDREFVEFVGATYKARFREGIYRQLHLPTANEVVRRYGSKTS